MFKFLVVAALLGVTLADVQVTHLKSEVNTDGSYEYQLQLDNGVVQQESGIGGQYANGGFRFISPEGEQVELSYTADAEGFHPQGSHLPTPPPIPEEILKAIRFIETNPTPEEQQDRQIRLQYNQ